jgi:crotonobetainyl-CoA:carnitine CoA-transferase CaiB-like acyl-CoA transferase
MTGRRANRAAVIAAITQVLRQAPAAEWVRRLAPQGVVVAEVGTLNEALQGDIAAARSLVVQLGDGSLSLQAVASPIRFDGFVPSYGLPPLLNEHADEVLGKVAV